MKFKVKKVNALGDHDEKYGQRYWGETYDSDMAISFNLMNPVEIPEGAELEFEERLIKETGPQSKNPGTEYLFLKKVKVLGATNKLALPTKDDDKLAQLTYENTEEILRILKQTVPPTTLKENWDKTVEKDTLVEDIDEEIDMPEGFLD